MSTSSPNASNLRWIVKENVENQVIIIKFEGAIAHFIVKNACIGKKLLDAVRFVGFRDSGLALVPVEKSQFKLEDQIHSKFQFLAEKTN